MTQGEGIVPSGTTREPEDTAKDANELVQPSSHQQVRVSRSYSEEFSGPVPHPKIVAEYQRIMPDAANRIFLMAEKQQDHRIDLEKSVIQSDIRRADLGLRLGFTLFVLFGVGSIVLLALGKNTAGFTLLGTSVGGGILNFIRVGRERQREAQAEKQPPIAKRKKRKHSRG